MEKLSKLIEKVLRKFIDFKEGPAYLTGKGKKKDGISVCPDNLSGSQ